MRRSTARTSTPGLRARCTGGVRVHVVVARDEDGVRRCWPHLRAGDFPAGWAGREPTSSADRARRREGRPADAASPTGVRGFEFDHLLPVPGSSPGSSPAAPRRISTPPAGWTDTWGAHRERQGQHGPGTPRPPRPSATSGRSGSPPTSWTRRRSPVVELKRDQYAATGARDYFAEPGRPDLCPSAGHPRDGSPASCPPCTSARSAGRALRHPVRSRAALVVPGLRPASSPRSRPAGSCFASSLAAPELGVTGSTSVEATTSTSGGPRPVRRGVPGARLGEPRSARDAPRSAAPCQRREVFRPRPQA